MTSVFDNKTILITGGTGSFGRHFTRFLLENSEAKKIIVFSRDELKQYHMSNDFKDSRLRFFIGDIRDLTRLKRAFNGVDIVVHAAALKQVPALEYNPAEAIQTNIIGSQNVVEAAIDNGVGKVLLISTDKAAFPVNLYGSTKLCAEKLFVSANSYSAGQTKFGVVRYGNVIGSRGSIVETILKNKHTGKIQITHEDMTRFWINYDQAFNLVAYALENLVGGEIFIPKIPTMRLIDLVNSLAPEATKEIIGIRPGEKMHEVLLTNDEARHSVELHKYYIVLPEFVFWGEDDQYNDYYAQGKKIENEEAYASNTSTNQLSHEELQVIISTLTFV